MRWYKWLAVIAAAGAIVGFFVVQNRLSAPVLGESEIANMRLAFEAEDESRFTIPPAGPRVAVDPDPLNNVYFGELHVHSNQSFDSYIFGNRFTPDEAYQFAKGNPVASRIGEPMQLAAPLDFAAVTDHAEGFGTLKQCGTQGLSQPLATLCQQMESPSVSLFLKLRSEGEKRPPERPAAMTEAEETALVRYAEETWAEIVAAANAHNDPGRFTAFAAYEYSPPLPDRGKIHRNVIFRNDTVPGRAVSAYDALTELDLWKALSTECKAPCEFLTIPHNPNKTWGLAFANHTIDGDVYDEADWRMRDRAEPLVEMYQIKGNSECALGLGTTDEECALEQFLPRCEDGQATSCIAPTSMARNGLKIGLELENELGFNPLDFGLIGATDSHNATPGDTEEWDYRGASGFVSATAARRLDAGPGGKYPNLFNNPGGLAAIWAPENTRDALFEAMQRKEVYATSGTRIRLRFFGSFGFDAGLADSAEAVETAYQAGVPMGGRLAGAADGAPGFFVWAMQDPMNARLDRVQIVKGWTENGETLEMVYDVACSDGREIDPQTNRCAKTKAVVDLETCAIDRSAGSAELKTLWTDPDYRSEQNAFYYARVVQNPTCRWSTYDSLRLGRAPPENVSETVTEMAWSSPIWVYRK